jgi:hypothetical protein
LQAVFRLTEQILLVHLLDQSPVSLHLSHQSHHLNQQFLSHQLRRYFLRFLLNP